MSRWIVGVLVMLLLLSNAWWFRHTVEQGVTLTYYRSTIYEQKKTLEGLKKLVLLSVQGKSVEEATKIIRPLFPESEPFVKDGYLNVDFLSFKIDSKGIIADVIVSSLDQSLWSY